MAGALHVLVDALRLMMKVGGTGCAHECRDELMLTLSEVEAHVISRFNKDIDIYLKAIRTFLSV